LAGPALGGVILAVAPPVLAFGLNAGSFLVSALVIATLSLQPPSQQPGEETPPDAPRHHVPARRRDAFTCLLATQEMRSVTMAAIGASLVVGVFSVMFVVVSVGDLGMGSSGTGFLFAAFGAGGVVGAIVAGRTIQRTNARRWVALMLAVTGLAIGAMAGARTPLLALLLAAAAGATGAFLEVLSITKVQEAFPRDTATVCGALDSLSYGSVLLGLLLAPLLVTMVGAIGCLLVVGLGLLLLAAASAQHAPTGTDPAGALVPASAVS
jgi:predicted MFS family arabinose efflux permease